MSHPQAPRQLAVIGYASLDSSTSVERFLGVDATSIVRGPLVSDVARIGGIAHVTAAAAAQPGVQVSAVSWVGDDAAGRRWREAVCAPAADGSRVDGTGIAVAGRRSPAATLVHVDTGGTICFFDPGDCHTDGLTPAQLGAVAACDWVLLTVAPSDCTTLVLDALPGHASLAWAVKVDEDAYPPGLVERLLARADLVSFSRGERPFLEAGGSGPEQRARPGALVVETRGADGVGWTLAPGRQPGASGSLAVDRVPTEDPTGAGDTFVGTLVALLCRAAGARPIGELPSDVVAAGVAQAALATGDVLRRRTSAPTTTARGED